MTRPWKFPSKSEGTTLSLTTDTHFGRRAWTPNHLDNIGRDLDGLSPFVDAYIHSGDVIHWDNATPEDSQSVPWFAARKAATSIPWLQVAGNHDLASYVSPNPSRTVTTWDSVYGLPGGNSTLTVGPVKIIGVSPDLWYFDTTATTFGPLVLSTATLAWLDTELAAAGSTPCWIVAHCPLPQHYPGLTTDNGITDLISSHTNVRGWLSGHRHANPVSDPNSATVITVGGKKIYSINGPAAGGAMGGLTDDHWGNPAYSTLITDTGGDVILRWRDHLGKGWAPTMGAYSRRLSLT